MEYFNTFIKGVFIENMIFAYFLGMCSYLAISKTVKNAVGLGIAVIFVLAVSVPVCYMLENYVLKAGGGSMCSIKSHERNFLRTKIAIYWKRLEMGLT